MNLNVNVFVVGNVLADILAMMTVLVMVNVLSAADILAMVNVLFVMVNVLSAVYVWAMVNVSTDHYHSIGALPEWRSDRHAHFGRVAVEICYDFFSVLAQTYLLCRLRNCYVSLDDLVAVHLK